MAQAPTHPTKTAIMDAAERLMAEHGLNGVSIRSILAEAGANTAALHYHFGSREKLVEAILARRGVEMNTIRRRLLDEIEKRKTPPTTYDIAGAAVDPLLTLLRNQGEAGRSYIRFLARLQTDRSPIHMELEDRYFPDIRARISKMLRHACAHMSDTELQQRVTMMLDAMLHSLANADVMTGEWSGREHEDALTRYAESLKNFLAAGLSAPASSDPSSARGTKTHAK